MRARKVFGICQSGCHIVGWGFHDEIIYNYGTVTYTNPLVLNSGSYTYTTHNTLGNTTFTTSGTNLTGRSIFTSGINNNVFYNQSLDHDGIACMDSLDNASYTKKATSALRHIETGRVEKGSDSDQKFTQESTNFYTHSCATDYWFIKPISIKPVVREELVTYCTECGAKKKKDTHKFCPHCGTKF